jgi:hypothetical protein
LTPDGTSIHEESGRAGYRGIRINIEVIMDPGKDRWARHRAFAAEWHSPLVEGDGVPEEKLQAAEKRLKLSLPAALREWYLLAGRRRDLVRKGRPGVFLATPGQLRKVEGGLIVYEEGDGVVQWGIRLKDIEMPDPPVCMDNSEPFCRALAHQEWIPENPTFSEFALQMLVMETLTSSRYYCWGWAEPAVLPQILSQLQDMGLPNWHYPADVTRFWSQPDVLVSTQQDAKGIDLVEVWVGSRNQASHREAVEVLPVKWDTPCRP